MELTWVLNFLQDEGKGEVRDEHLRSFRCIGGIDKA